MSTLFIQHQNITHVVEDNHVLNHYEYDVWGNLTVCEETVENRFKYNGHQFDPISQQYYLRARYYNPVIGRFTQEDTYRGDGLNLYAYCRNNPVFYVDPSGHKVCKKGVTRITEAIKKRTATKDDVKKLSEHLREKMHNGKRLNKAEKEAARQLGYDISKKFVGLPDWLKERFEAGNNFNKENRKNYTYNEVEVYGKKKYVVDSYIPGEEIVSRKYTQLADVKESTGIGYLNELKTKYPSGAIITDGPFNPKILRGQPMRGQQILEIPVQNKPIPKSVIDYANSNNIIIRDVERNVYN